MSDTTTTPTQKPPLSREIVGQMMVAMQNVIRLSQQAVRTPNDDAELSGNRTFLARAFITYAGEFLGCWLAVTDEYTPLVTGFAALQSRAGAYLAARAQAELAQQAPADAVKTDGSAPELAEGKIVAAEFSNTAGK